MFALVDCNNFYASCERVFNPNLNHVPVAILSNNDGCIISRSDEAKALKLPMGAPIFKWQSFCKHHNITVLSSNYPLYGDMSSRVMSILGQFTPDVEIYSIDEAFLQFKGFDAYNFNTYGLDIKQRVFKWTGIPTSVGIAPTKALSKVANKIARKFPKETGGVYVIDSEEKRLKALKWLKIEDVWGIGYKIAKRLKPMDVNTAYDFTQLSDAWVKRNFSIVALRLKQDLQGLSRLSLESLANKKAIATTRSFEYTLSDIEAIKERISTFATNCAEKLRQQKTCSHMLIVFVRSHRHKTHLPQHRASKIVKLSSPTNSTLLLSKAAVNALEQIYKPGIKYKKAGVIVTGLVPDSAIQLNLFENKNAKHIPLMHAIDKLNFKMRKDLIKLANQDLNRTWKMRQEHLTPKYTTNINDIITVK